MVLKQVNVVGHPFAPIGVGEQARNVFRTLKSFGRNPGLYNVHNCEISGVVNEEDFQQHLVTDLENAINLFYVNGDEVPRVKKALGGQLPLNSYNIIVPAWELPKYPEPWANNISVFDEIWGVSEFISHGIREYFPEKVQTMPTPVDPRPKALYGRRYFGIPESSFVFLFMFDSRSYVTRKNPGAAIEAYRRAMEQKPFTDAVLVIKTNPGGFQAEIDEVARQARELNAHGARCLIIDEQLTFDETKSLVNASDCFLGLQRSEGFGLGIAEAMFFGVPVITSLFSGQAEFVSPEACKIVRHTLVPVQANEYPFGYGQHWAEPNVDDAVEAMVELMCDRTAARRLGRLGSYFVRRRVGTCAAGRRIVNRLDQIGATRVLSEPASSLK